MEFDKSILDILVCPECKKELVFKEELLDCTYCKLRFPIQDGIPIMLKENAEKYID